MRSALLAAAGVALVAVVAGACATGEAAPPNEPLDDGGPEKDASTDDSGRPQFDADLGCELGSADHCGSCSVACIAGTAMTKAVCTDATASGVCDIVCRGEAYDVDGKVDNGCEAVDEAPHDSMGTAEAIT